MLIKLTILIFVSLIGGGVTFQKWSSLKATWCYQPEKETANCFQNIPLKASEAVAAGYRELSDGGCDNYGKFNGRRFIKGNDVGLTPLYDINGIIAGLQMNLLKDELFAKENPYKYAEVPSFLDNEVDGRPVYTLTYYFIEPGRICTRGRTNYDLELEGTGTGLFMQVGPDASSHCIDRIPLYRDAATKQGWTENLCVPTMGHHNYWRVTEMADTQCTKIRPAFLLFNNQGEMLGFGGLGIGNMTSLNFEHPDQYAVLTGTGDLTPPCLTGLSEYPGFSNIHVFFLDEPRQTTCETIVQTKDARNLFVNPNVKPKYSFLK